MIEAFDGISVVPISEHNVQKVIQYDKQVYKGLDRTALIEEMAKILEYVNRVAINEKGQVLGYCFLKVSIFDKGIVEPLYANDEKIAELLLRKCCELLAITQDNGLLYSCPNTNLKSISIANKLGLTLEKEAPVLFTKKELDGDLDRVFCRSSPCYYPF